MKINFVEKLKNLMKESDITEIGKSSYDVLVKLLGLFNYGNQRKPFGVGTPKKEVPTRIWTLVIP